MNGQETDTNEGRISFLSFMGEKGSFPENGDPKLLYSTIISLEMNFPNWKYVY